MIGGVFRRITGEADYDKEETADLATRPYQRTGVSEPPDDRGGSFLFWKGSSRRRGRGEGHEDAIGNVIRVLSHPYLRATWVIASRVLERDNRGRGDVAGKRWGRPGMDTRKRMTETQWHQCSDPDQLLWHRPLKDRLSERKLRLFACSCCRRIWDRVTDERSRNVVAVAERYADGKVTLEELVLAREKSLSAENLPRLYYRAVVGPSGYWTPGTAATSVAATGSRFSPRHATHLAKELVHERTGTRDNTESWEQSCLFRDIFGNPFNPVTFDASWLTWNDGAIARAAAAAYEERSLPTGHLDNARLAVLADMLEEAGCRDDEMLGHLRKVDGVHVRGCWTLDLLLGRE